MCSIESDDGVGNATELRNVRLRLTQEKSVRLPDLCNNAPLFTCALQVAQVFSSALLNAN